MTRTTKSAIADAFPALSLLVVVLAFANGLRAWAGYRFFGATLTPDTDLYTQGGIGLFPSPLGRLLGNGGEAYLAFANSVAAVLIVLAVADFALKLGGRPTLAAAVFVLCPLSWWSMFAGVDTLAALFIVGGFVYGRGALPWHWLVAVGLHLAALLVVASYALTARRRLGLWLVAAGAAVALLTPYRGMFGKLDPFVFSSSATVTALVFVLCLPLLVFSGRALAATSPAIIGGAVASGLMASAPFETNMRYLLPAVAVGSACCGCLTGNPHAAARSAAARARAFFGGAS